MVLHLEFDVYLETLAGLRRQTVGDDVRLRILGTTPYDSHKVPAKALGAAHCVWCPSHTSRRADLSRKMFVRVGKVDGVPDEGGKGGWWTVKMGVPDEGRPGRKGKGKRRSDADSEGIGAGAEQDGSAVGPALLSLGHKGHGQGQGQGQGELQGQDPSMGHGHGDAQAQGPVAVPTAHVGANVQ